MKDVPQTKHVLRVPQLGKGRDELKGVFDTENEAEDFADDYLGSAQAYTVEPVTYY